MPYYDPYQATPSIQQYVLQGQYAPIPGAPMQGMPMQGMPSPGAQVPGMPDMSELQQYIYPANLQSALQLIVGAVAGEREDRLFYEYLISTAPSNEDKEIIRGIRDNEIHHFALFRLLYYQLTGQVLPPPKETPFTKPASYCTGLAKALQGEEGAVIRYRKILFALQNRVHINMLTEIITDELRHGTLYSYLYSKNGCRV
jgi:rubrerythrin